MSGGAGTVAKMGVPLALTALRGGVLAPALLPLVGGSELAAGALAGAGAGALGSALTGGDPIKGAVLGGIGGGIGGSADIKGILNGADSASSVVDAGNVGAEQVANATNAATLAPAAAANATNAASLAQGASSATPSVTSGIGSMLSRNALPIAGGLAVLATSGNQKQSAALQGNDRQPNDIQPLQRTQLATDPNAYFGIGGARQSFTDVNPVVNPNTKYFADGGSVRDKSDMQQYHDMAELTRAKMSDHPMGGPASFIVDRYKSSGYPGSLSEYVADEYGNTPIASAIQANEAAVRRYASGGSALYQKAKGPSSFKQGAFHLAAGGRPISIPQVNVPRPHIQGIGSLVNGAGDGQSDQIPAMLSDGEYVIPAPVVSAIGRGSNNAGAKKLDKMKNHVMAKTYKGGKPPSAGLGIGAMRVA